MLSDLQKALQAGLKVQVTVWDPKNESVEHAFDSHVMEASGLRFRIAPPQENAATILPLMGRGILVGVVLAANPAPFIFYPVIQDVPPIPAQGYWLSIPYDAEVEVFQRRKHVRIPMIIPIEVEIPSGSSGSNMTISARTSDVSGGGLRITSPRNLAAEQVLIVNLQFGEDQPKMRLKATVIFSMPNKNARHPEDLYATACQFLNIDDAEEMMIVRECFRRELGMKQKP